MGKILENIKKKKLPVSKKSIAIASHDFLHQLAFDNSLQPNIITTVSNGKIISANIAASKLLGYPKKELLTKSRGAIFDINESGFKKMLKQRTAEGQSKGLVTARKKSGKPFSCEITSAVFRDEDGIEKAITTITDMSQSIARQKNIDSKKEKIVAGNIISAKAKSDARLAENDEKFLLAAKLSFDGIWDWNLLSNELFLGGGFEELFGYTLKNNKGNIADWSNYLHPDDKQAVQKGLRDAIASSSTHWEQAYRFIRADGSIAKVFDRASIIRHADGKAYRMIGAMKDISRQRELEEMLDHEIAAKWTLLSENKESVKFFFNSPSAVFYDADLVANEVTLSDAYEKEFGYKLTSHMIPDRDWLSHIHPDDKEAVMQDYLRMVGSGETKWKYNYRFLRADDSVANVLSSGIILRKAGGKAYRMIGYMLDTSKQKVLEEKLEQEIRLKEKQIEEATEEAKETERSEIGRELHDNVNQLLGVSRLYLDMAKQGGENSEMYLSQSSEYTLSAIEEIRKITKGLTSDTIRSLGLCEAINTVTRDTMEVNPVKISCALDSFVEQSVNDKFKLNVLRILQEQLNNILKHAKATEVSISLLQNKKSIILTIADNGVGFDTTKKRKGIGVDNIRRRAATYSGMADFVSQPGQGCVLTVTFPDMDTPLNRS